MAYGLFPALMQSRQQALAEEQRAEDNAMRQRQMAMQEAMHNQSMQEGGLRLEGLRRQRQTADELAAAVDADTGMPMVEGPAGLPSNMPTVDGPAGGAPSNMPMVGAPPVAGLQSPGASKFDRAAMRAAALSGDVKGVYGVKDRIKAEGTAASRKSEFKRLMGMSDQDLVAAFEPMNAHPGFKGMLNFDPKSKQFLLVSQIPGLETQAMTKEELVNSMMGIWEAGNGDFEKGMALMMTGAQRRREIDNSNFDRSGKLAGMNADLHFKGRAADATDAQRAEQGRHNRAMEGNSAAGLNMQRDRMQQEDWAIVGVSQDKKGLLRFNKRTGATEVQPLPAGTDADGLLRRITGQGSATMTPQQQLEMRAKLKTAGYDDAAIEQMVTGYDPIAAMAAQLEKMRSAKQSAAAVPTQAGPEPGLGSSENERLWRAGGGPQREMASAVNAQKAEAARAMRQRVDADPDVQRLRGMVAAAARGEGPPVDRLAVETQIANIAKTRYGAD